MTTNDLPHIFDLDRVRGGLDFAGIKQQAQPYCPSTVAKYSSLNPSSINRAKAQQMGNECLIEMGSFKAGFARSRIQAGIDQAFPPK